MYKTVIVEDDLDTLELLDQVFPKSEFATFLETNARAACKTIDLIRPDLVVSDVVLMDLNGFEIVRHIRQSKISTIIIMITGASAIAGKTAYDLDVDLFLRKPFDPDELNSAAKSYLRRHDEQPFTSNLTRREIDVIRLIAQGFTSLEIGGQLGISHKTVAKHRENMMRRLNAKNVADLIIKSGVLAPLR